MIAKHLASVLAAMAVIAGCGGMSDRPAERIVVFNAGSLAIPVRAALDSFAVREHVTIAQENAGSLETARKLTELGHIPDVVALADYEVFPQYLMPAQVDWYLDFARNRMVLAYTPKSRFANEITPENWWKIVQRPGVQVGRADPNLDPNGYRTLLTMQLAETYYGVTGLYDSLLTHAPENNVRPKEADLVGLLQAGEMDYIWSYESLASAAGLKFVQLPAAIDLSSPADSARYAMAQVRVRGKSPGDSVTFRGQPIVYALSIPKKAPHPELAERFVAYLISDEGARIMRTTGLDVLATPVVVGSGVPAAVAAAAKRTRGATASDSTARADSTVRADSTAP
ncbi:MAG TPA: tungstate ABC transporter substrate-binding protein WtpA [Gemmatimonadaceae bacterium]|nr:tungstate ABC transporter substrate-binding protein WtpA [Gemmatimonadaceae bacterium]